MTDHDHDEFFAKYGVDIRLAGGPDNPALIEPALTSAGEQAQTDLLRQFAGMRATIEMLEVMVRDRPTDDRSFDIFDEALAMQLADASEALRLFRDRRDCKGAA